MFSGGAFSNASIFALGIMPYISASIVIQLLGIAVPYFQKLQREGESGRRKMNQYTRYLTIIVLLVQAPSYLFNLKMQAGPSLNASLDWTLFMFTSTIILAGYWQWYFVDYHDRYYSTFASIIVPGVDFPYD